MKRLAIIGAGTLGQQMAQHIAQNKAYHVAGFFDDFAEPGTVTPYGPVLGAVSDVQPAFAQEAFDEVLLAVGYQQLSARQRLYEQLAPHIPFGQFIHPTAYVDPSAKVGAGTFLSPGCLLDLNAELKANVFLYTGCIIGHDSQVGNHSFLAPGVHLAGRVQVGAGCFLGISTTVVDGCTLAAGVRTGGGTVVTHPLAEAGTYVGAPARRL